MSSAIRERDDAIRQLSDRIVHLERRNKRLEDLVEFGEGNIKIQFEACMVLKQKLTETRNAMLEIANPEAKWWCYICKAWVKPKHMSGNSWCPYCCKDIHESESRYEEIAESWLAANPEVDSE